MNKTKSNAFPLKDFKTLHVYQKAIALENEIDEIVKTLPPFERYRLEDQLVTSIGANIAEANGLPYVNRERYHLTIAFGSANEVKYWIGRACRKGYIMKKHVRD
jgi:four helix bundle protein